MTIEQIKSRIEKMIRTAETGEDWAEICALESQMIEQESSHEAQ